MLAIKRIFQIILMLLLLSIAFVAITNVVVINSVKDRIISVQEAAKLAEGNNPPQTILVLGCSVYGDHPSVMLAARLDSALEIFKSGGANHLLLSGDNGQVYYNEVQAMEKYALEHGADIGVTANKIQLDHAGFSTYESMYRLRDVFLVDSAVVVTQKYHLYRALYNGKHLGTEVYGVEAEPSSQGQLYRDIREILARTKDFCYVLLDVKPTFLGETIPIG